MTLLYRYKAGQKEISLLEKIKAEDPNDKRHVIRLLRTFEVYGHLCMAFESLRYLPDGFIFRVNRMADTRVYLFNISSMNLREVQRKFGRDVGLNVKAIKVYAQQLMLALTLLAKAGILHADIKPDNILVNENFTTLKLADLGSACTIQDAEITPYLVSRYYRSPEIILGMPYDHQLDIWSVACTLYELYAGHTLFPGRNNNAMLKLMMETKGKFPQKMLRRGACTELHFDADLKFDSREIDSSTGNVVVRKLQTIPVVRDIKSRLLTPAMTSKMAETELEMVTLFVDFLDRCLELVPEKRLNCREALRHRFLQN